jgi:hypothetical protein
MERARGCGGCGCAGLFFCVCVAVTAVLPLMQSLGRTIGTLEHRPPPTPQPSPGAAGSTGEFERRSSGSDEELRYGFSDYEGRAHRLTCFVSREAHEAETDRFGYVDEEAQREVTRRMIPLVQAELRGRGYGSGVVRVYATGRLLYWELKGQGAGTQAYAEVSSIVDAVWSRDTPQVQAEVYKQHGFLLDGRNNLGIDYPAIAERAAPILQDCGHALYRAGTGYDLGQYLGLFVAFLQEIPYEVPPNEQGQKHTGGFYVPSEVLVGHHGDCDSKSAAFCALWMRFGSPMLIVDLPHHVLVGVALPPRAGQQYVQIGADTFVLCEVAGPGKLRPGVSDSVSGLFNYQIIRPGRAGIAVTTGAGRR